MVHRRVLALLVAGAFGVALVGCGEDREGSVTVEGGTGTQTTGTTTTGTGTGTSTSATPAGKPSSTFDIRETEFKLAPANFRIGQPGAVQFRVTNDGGTVHALEVEGPTGEFETEEIQPGDAVTLKADVSQAGTYKLYCPVGDHEDRGMVGKLVVGGAGAGPSADDGDREREADDNSGSGGGGSGDNSGSDNGGSGSGGSGSGGSGSGGDTGGAAAPDY